MSKIEKMLLVLYSIMAFAMCGFFFTVAYAEGLKSKKITVHLEEDPAGNELVRVNETDKVVTVTTEGEAAGWRCISPTPTPMPSSNNGRVWITPNGLDLK